MDRGLDKHNIGFARTYGRMHAASARSASSWFTFHDAAKTAAPKLDIHACQLVGAASYDLSIWINCEILHCTYGQLAVPCC